MPAIPRERILARRKRLNAKQNQIRTFQEKLQEEEKRLEVMIQERKEMKYKIIGRIIVERMKSDLELKTWFEREIKKKLIKKQERDLFSLN